MTFARSALWIAVIGMVAVLSGCGALGSQPSSRAISVSFTPGLNPPASMNTSTTAVMAATVSNDPANLGVNWKVTCGSASCGAFSPTSTGSKGTTQFTAPPAIPNGNTVTITATSVADGTKSVSATVSITQGAAISVTIVAPRASMNVNSTAPFTAVVTNDPQNAGVNWSVACGSAPCGSFITQNPVGSGSAASYQAPPSLNTVTLTATSVTDSTKSASATVSITQPATPLTDGTYVFHLGGSDFSSANGESNYYVAGAFTISGGVISGGEQDFVDYDDAVTDSINPSTSSLAVTADGNVQIALDTGDPAVGINGVETLNASFVSSTRALIGEYDLFASGTGTLDWQPSQAPPADGYAFFVTGIDSNLGPLALGGILNVDGAGSISGAGSVFDLNDASALGIMPNQSISPSSVLGPGGSVSPDSFGRVTFVLNPANPGIGQLRLVGYVVDSNTIQLIETVDALGGTTGGTALSQNINTGLFTDGSLGGLTYIVGAEGVDTNGPLQLAGALAFDSSANGVAGNATSNDIANQLSGNIASGTYSVDATGRTTITGLNGPTFINSTLELYLDGNGNAFVISMDASDVTAGAAFQQSPNPSFSGPYAVIANGVAPMTGNGPPSPLPWNAAGQVFGDGSGNITGYTDFNVLAGPLSANVELTGIMSGSGSIQTGPATGLSAASSTASDTFTYYLVDNYRAFGIEADARQLGLLYLEAVPPSK